MTKASCTVTGDFSNTQVQGQLVHDMRYLASVVTQCFSAFGELLGMQVTSPEAALTCLVARVSLSCVRGIE